MQCVLPLITAASILVAASSAQPAAQQNVAVAERDVRQTLESLVAAYGSNELETYFSFFADDMTVWWGTRGRNDRPTPKAEYMRSWPEYIKKSGGYDNCQLADLRIQVAPAADAAVSSYELVCTFKKPPAGEPRAATYEITSVLFKRDGAWKIVHFNWRDRAPAATPPRR